MIKHINKTFFICTGVGHISRGYETHMSELFETLIKSGHKNMLFLKGAGKNCVYEKRIYCLKRNQFITKLLSKITGKPSEMIEQISFYFFSILSIIFLKPNVIYTPNFVLLRLYAFTIKILKLNTKTILCTGKGFQYFYKEFDRIQYILPVYSELDNETEKFVIPHGFDCERFVRKTNKSHYRRVLNLPMQKTIILTVGAVNNSVKRMDYIINELASIKKNDIFLLILGNEDQDTKDIIANATNKFADNFMFKTVNYSEINNYYLASDIFCSASIFESFGKVYVEAALAGLPVIAHDFDNSRYVLGENALFINMKEKEALKNIIQDYLKGSIDYNSERVFKHIKKYCWQNLLEDYEKLLFLNKKDEI